MKAAIISLQSESSKMTARAMEKYFDEVDSINIKEVELTFGDVNTSSELLYNGKPLSKYDCVYVKGSFKYAEVAAAITAILSRDTYCPTDAQAFTIVHDKILTHIMLQRHKIATPKTYLSATQLAAKTVLKNISYPVILKFPKGTQGKGVMVADSYSAASSLMDALVTLRQPFLIQEYIETGGADIRAFVVGNRVVAAMKRRAQGGEKRSNVHAGGIGEPYELDPKTKRLAIETAKALNIDICGIDLLESPKGGLVLEANVSPGLQGIMKATNIDIPEKIAQFLYKQAQEFNEKRKTIAPKTEELMQEIGVESLGAATKQIIMNVDYRGNRILLPEIVSKASRFDDGEEVVFEVDKKDVRIKRV